MIDNVFVSRLHRPLSLVLVLHLVDVLSSSSQRDARGTIRLKRPSPYFPGATASFVVGEIHATESEQATCSAHAG